MSTDQPPQYAGGFVYQGIKAGYDDHYLPTAGEGLSARRGESCKAHRIIPGQQGGMTLIVVKFADGEEMPVAWTALRGIRERVRVA
ncbi:hypothetical protein [Deinococcus altitudinis]|uniref:hypothetical protein n=1 Tax=Deinococcus altitudinis TaxID=468914 RepID=UPI00389221FC